jgi:O-antigen ligase
LAAILGALAPLRQFVLTRVSNPPLQTEQLSVSSRLWLVGQAADIISEHPWLGVGAGSFSIELASRAEAGIPVEPVHSLPLLISAELGLPGLALLIGLGISIARQLGRAHTRRQVLSSAILVGLGVTALFDHNLWTLAPGRVLLGLALGLWAGQFSGPDAD